ncbi:hypothetical protein H5410_036656 [Solanum commersonii]|uniref:Isopenicillin N synthase-like Fe(2+) 2OG dioxygenase domain-containing protein n=1 Tax=Solanum commersonii TaxID=4109 RepID=A0A9J5Y767_SOLCO|nr:hypothetical protein H5410_036656 [Solanum commersonii]
MHNETQTLSSMLETRAHLSNRYDPTSLTVLHQDCVSRLHVFVDNEWYSISPNFHSFVVNIGDTIMVTLSNGRYESCLQRVGINNKNLRKSLAFFLCSDKELIRTLYKLCQIGFQRNTTQAKELYI